MNKQLLEDKNNGHNTEQDTLIVECAVKIQKSNKIRARQKWFSKIYIIHLGNYYISSNDCFLLFTDPDYGLTCKIL